MTVICTIADVGTVHTPPLIHAAIHDGVKRIRCNGPIVVVAAVVVVHGRTMVTDGTINHVEIAPFRQVISRREYDPNGNSHKTRGEEYIRLLLNDIVDQRQGRIVALVVVLMVRSCMSISSGSDSGRGVVDAHHAE